jgi:hypothetical protein
MKTQYNFYANKDTLAYIFDKMYILPGITIRKLQLYLTVLSSPPNTHKERKKQIGKRNQGKNEKKK